MSVNVENRITIDITWAMENRIWPMTFGNMRNIPSDHKPTMTLEEWDKARADFEDKRDERYGYR